MAPPTNTLGPIGSSRLTTAGGRRRCATCSPTRQGVPDVRHVADLLHASSTPSGGRPPNLSVDFGQALPSFAAYYRGGLQVVVEPGSAFAYSNHGYATLGQIVEDVSGVPLERYFRQRIFKALGMADSGLVRSDRVGSRLATGYALGSRGPKAVADRDWIGAGAGGICSTARRHRPLRRRAARRGRQRAWADPQSHGPCHDVRGPLPAGQADAGHGPRILPRQRPRPPPHLPRPDPARLQLGAPRGARRRDRRHRLDQRFARSFRLAVVELGGLSANCSACPRMRYRTTFRTSPKDGQSSAGGMSFRRA